MTDFERKTIQALFLTEFAVCLLNTAVKMGDTKKQIIEYLNNPIEINLVDLMFGFISPVAAAFTDDEQIHLKKIKKDIHAKKEMGKLLALAHNCGGYKND